MLGILKKKGDIGVLIIRLTLALIFIVHGWAKLFFFGAGGSAEFFSQLGIPFPLLSALLIIFLELGGGILLILGLFTRYLGALYLIEMITAIALVHWRNGFFIGQGSYGYEFALSLALMSLSLIFLGGGKYWNLERRLFRREL